MTVKLDLKNEKILSLLDQNSRISNTQLAKKVGLSKPAIEYRINNLEKKDIIFKYYTEINFTKLGYSHYKLYFKLQNTSPQKEKEIIEYWVNQRNTVWVAEIRGKVDVAVSIFARNNYEFGSFVSDFTNKFSENILDTDVLLTEYSPNFSKDYLPHSIQSEFVFGVPQDVYLLDETDQKLLKILSQNARVSIIDLANQANMTRDIASYRLKKLIKNNIISKFRCSLNLHNISINHYKIIFRTKNFNEKEQKRLYEYLKSHKKATQMLKAIGSWDLEIEIEAESEDELYDILADIRNKFSNIIRDYDIIRLLKTFKYDYFPF